jgi:hypothetical protein
MVAGTATAVSVALLNDRRLAPAFVEAAPAPSRTSVVSSGAAAASFPLAKTFILRRIAVAVALAVGGIAIAASLPAVTAYASGFWSTSSTQTMGVQGPEKDLRAAAGVAGNWERSVAAGAAPIEQLGALAIAGVNERNYQELVSALNQLAAEEQARAASAAASNARVSAGAPYSRNAASGYAPGTVLRSRITIYGCVGPGGGFCGGMASGVGVFEGAAACSSDMKFGTRFRIHSDPTGRVYECLDRGHLNSTWVDIFFHDTREGIAWQSLLGGTIAQIEIVN